MRLPGLLLAFLLSAGCASDNAQPPPYSAGEVDLARYQGTWYELARLPMFFQRHCVESEAHYRLQAGARVGVTNRCRTAAGEWQQAHGTAEPQQAGRSDRLWVRFDNGFSRLFPRLARGDYWILYLDPDYRVALVGSPDRDYLWLLSRTPEVDARTRERLLDEARARGYATGELVWRGESQ